MVLVIALFILFMSFHVWALRAYLDFMDTHPEVERRLVERAMKQCY